MTLFLFTYIKKVQKWYEKDNFEYKDWLSYLDVLKMVSSHESIEEMEFEGSPDGEKGETLKLEQVLKIMKYVSLQIEMKNEDLDSEGRESKFVCGNLIR